MARFTTLVGYAMVVNLRRILRQHFVKTVPIQTVLVVPFLLQVIGIVSLVAYVSYRHGEQTRQNLAYSLTDVVSARVSDRLNTYLQAPHQFLAISRVQLEQGGALDAPFSLEPLHQLFWRQLRMLTWLNSIHFTSVEGAHVGVLREHADRDLTMRRLQGNAPGTLESYRLDQQGQPLQRTDTQAAWEPRALPGYRVGLATYTSTWTPIDAGGNGSRAALTAVTPIYRDGQLLGVLGVDLGLEDIHKFLQNLQVSPPGTVFLMERSGLLVATSTLDGTVQGAGRAPMMQRRAAIDSSDPSIHAASQYLLQQWGNLQRIQEAQTFTFTSDRPTPTLLHRQTRYFARVLPYQDAYGLDWLVVVVIPAEGMVNNVYENIRQTVIWSGFAMLGAIALGVYTTRWIMQPLLALRDSANRIAQGEFTLKAPATPILELRQLAFSFREMANQVQLSLYEMQTLNADLNESRANLEKFLDGVPVGVIVHNGDGSVAYLNQTAKRLLGVAGPMTEGAIAYDLYWAGSDVPYPPSHLPVCLALQGAQVEEVDLEIHRDGLRIPVEVLATPIMSKDGQISHAIVALQDVSTRKEAARVLANYNRQLEEQVQKRTLALEQEIQERQQIAATLRQRETTLRAILHTIPDLLIRLRQDGTAIERLSLGEVNVLNSQNPMGHPIHDYLPQPLAQARLDLIQRAIATGQVQIEEYQIAVDGGLRDEEARVVKAGEDEVLVIVRDISDRKGIERALQQSEAQNRAILAAIPDLMFRVHRNGIYLGYVKTSALLDLLPPDLDPVGRHLNECLPPDISERHLHYIERALDTEQLQVYEQENWFGGMVQYEEVRVIPCGPDEALFLVRDIGDRKRIEKELRLANLRLKQLAQTDGLTQVANRRHFDDRLRQEWQALAQEQEPLSLVLFDVDYFKCYNDHYGHQAGDLCLVNIATVARQTIRHPMDLVARYGGEEFVIILPKTDAPGAMGVAERLRRAIQSMAIPHAQSSVSDYITISVGVSTLIPSLQIPPDNLLTQADQALYLAKQQGRNRTIAFPQKNINPKFERPR